jgi:hypothetical protein
MAVARFLHNGRLGLEVGVGGWRSVRCAAELVEADHGRCGEVIDFVEGLRTALLRHEGNGIPPEDAGI